MRVARWAVVLICLASTVACTPTQEDPVPPVDAKPRGGVIEIGVVGEPATLDPYGKDASDLTYALVRPVFPMPFRMLPDGTIEPELAESLEITVSGARLTILEQDWSNGRQITARDVVASIRRATAPSGFHAIRNARAVGRRVIEMTGKRVDWELNLATAAFVMPRGRLTGANVSGGPFRFSSYRTGRSLSYEANSAASQPPLLDGLRVSFVQGTDLLIRLLQMGDIDAAAIPSTVNLGTRLDELGIAHDSAVGTERILLSFDPERLSLDAARAVGADIDRANLIASFVRDEGGTLGTRPEESPGALPASLSIAVPEGDELLSLMQRAIQLDLQDSGPTVELISAPGSTLYGPWRRGAPADALLMRAIGPPPWSAVELDGGYAFPLASVATFVAWREEVHGLAVNPSPEGPLWNANQWWIEPPI